MCLLIGFFELLVGIGKIMSTGAAIAAFIDVFATHFFYKKLQLLLSGNTK